MLADSNRSMPEVSAVLAEDQAMVARILKVSNSPLYRSGEEIRTLRHALTRLGVKTIRNLVLSASTRSMFPMAHTTLGMWSRALWQHAKECALCARAVARAIGYSDPEEAFAGGMLHDLGKLIILLNHADAYRQIRKKQFSKNQSSVEAEQSVLGFDHTVAGEMLMKKWQMPPILRACVRYHHQSEEVEEFQQVVRIVSYGNHLSNLHGVSESAATEKRTEVLERERQFLGIDTENAEIIESTIIADLKQSDVFD
jgi:putative nucleotidyltransferase with HDIG domain